MHRLIIHVIKSLYSKIHMAHFGKFVISKKIVIKYTLYIVILNWQLEWAERRVS